MWRNIIKWILLTLNAVSALLFVGCCVSSYISPAKLPFLSVVNLGFPLVLAGNLLWIVLWLFVKRKYSLISFIALLLGSLNLLSYFSFFPHKTKVSGGSKTYTIMTYNVKNFDLYNWKVNVASKKQIMEVIKSKAPDVLCLQEFYSDSTKHFNTLSELIKIYPYYHFYKSLTLEQTHYWGQATFSKFPITNKRLLSFENSKHNLCMVSEIQLGDSVVSIYNVHLQSFHFDNHDYESMEALTANGTTEKVPVRKWYTKLRDATQRRAVQADILAKSIKDNPNKVVLCGDFNDSPNSYAYHTVSKGLDDAFIKGGWGFGQTYNGPFPSLRIDYILVNPLLKVANVKVLREGVSDHFAVLAELMW